MERGEWYRLWIMDYGSIVDGTNVECEHARWWRWLNLTYCRGNSYKVEVQVKMAPTSISPAKYLCLPKKILWFLRRTGTRNKVMSARPYLWVTPCSRHIFISSRQIATWIMRQISATWMIIARLPRSPRLAGLHRLYWNNAYYYLLARKYYNCAFTFNIHKVVWDNAYALTTIHPPHWNPEQILCNAYIFTRKSCRSRPRRCIPLWSLEDFGTLSFWFLK